MGDIELLYYYYTDVTRPEKIGYTVYGVAVNF